MKVTPLLCILPYFNFAWNGTLRPNNSVQACNLVDYQMQLILMSRGRNRITTKVAESKSVLGAEFLFTTFSFDLVLTVQVFEIFYGAFTKSSWGTKDKPEEYI